MVQSALGTDTEMIDPGEVGANANWDYSNVMKDETVPTTIFEFTDPSVSSSANLFPDANIAVVFSGFDPNTQPVTFYNKSSDKYEVIGNALPLTSIVFSDPQTIMEFPFSYGDVLTDNFTGESNFNNFITYIKGAVVLTADAYGTIKTPKGTFEDVIRVKTETSRVDSTNFFSESYTLVIYNIVNYIWLNNTIGTSIASLSFSSGEIKTVTQGMIVVNDLEEFRSFVWSDNETSSLKEIEGDLQLEILSYGPNPTTEIFNINLESECNCPINMEIINYLGEVIQTDNFNLNYGNNTIDVQLVDLPAGNYFVKLSRKDGFGIFQVQKI